ncbi:Exoglucanase B precursor [Legionella massiliensis]|uniref:Exoglucanase B n=1 Tax=Legionella massiliensis TaxID=1034943 RepID=A0A078KSI4_9GAMM|nr:Ig-like domain repeat protein [Legionella massiliensis]CDZ76026.1 Exoglucanase B precursor [Legionella massiliensis]CEE11764.1 Exoglucanase B precursor [Legionella massiliensis]
MTTNVTVVSRENAVILQKTTSAKISLSKSSIVEVGTYRDQVKKIEQAGNSVVITLKNGEIIKIDNFFGPLHNKLVFIDHKGGFWQVDFINNHGVFTPGEYTPLASIDSLLLPIAEHTAASLPLWLLGGGAAAGLAALGISASQHDDHYHSGHNGIGLFPLDTTDTTPPSAPVVNPVNGTNPISGTAEPGSTVIITFPDGTTASAVASLDGSWTIPNPGNLPNGGTITVVAVDQSGNVSPPTTVIIDSLPPATPILAGLTDDQLPVLGAITAGGSTNDTTPTLSGTAEAGATISIYDNGILLGTTTADASGNWSFTTNSLPEGAHSLTITATDAVGNVSSPTLPFSFTVDTTAPATPIADPTDGTTFKGTAEPGSTVSLDFNGDGIIDATVITDNNGNWQYTSPTPIPNDSVVSVQATDAAGNSSPTITVTVNSSLDTTPPAAPVITNVTDNVAPITGNIAAGSSSNDSTPTLSGTAEAGSTIQIYDNGTLIGSVLTDAASNWTFTPSTPLADGAHNLTMTATDAAGNVSTATSFAFTVDTTAPTAPTVNPSDGTTFTGTAEPGSTVGLDLDNNGTIDATVVADASGNWSYTTPSSVSNGQTVNVQSIDAAGNISPPASVIVNSSLDTTPPAAPVIGSVTDNVAPVIGTISVGTATNDSTPTLTGTAEAGSTLNVYDNGTLLGSVITDPSGNWTFTPSTPLADGTHNLTTTATDSAGNVSTPTSFAFTVDTTAPAAPTVNPSDGTTFTGTAEPGSTVGLDLDNNGTIDATVVANASGNWSYTSPSPVANGQTVNVQAIDAAGNISPPASVVINNATDTTPPATPVIGSVTDNVAPIIGSISAGESTNDSTPTLTGTAEAGSTVRIYDNGTLIGSVTADSTGNWSFTPSTPLANGAHSLTVTATDAAGNVSTPTAAFGFTVDTTAPAIPIIAGLTDNVAPVTGLISPGGSTNDSTPTLMGTAEPGTLISVYDGNTLLGTTTTDSIGNWSFTPTLADGSHSLTVTATDAAGNVSSPTATLAFTVDTSAPAAPVITAVTDNALLITGAITAGGTTNDSTPTLTGTAEANATIKIFDGQVELGTTIADSSGNWSFTPSSSLLEGSHSLRATATDAAGNVSPSTPPFSFTIDLTAPIVTVNGLVTNDNTPAMVGTINDPTSAIVVTINHVDYTATNNGNGTWTLADNTVTTLADGSYTVTVTAIDPAGNVGTAINTLTVNTAAPSAPMIVAVTDNVAPVIGPILAGGSTNDQTPTVTGAAAAGSTISVYDGGTLLGTTTANSSGSWSFTPASLPAGSHSITVTATDGLGNVSAPTAPFAFTVDVTSPAVTVDGLLTNDSTPALTGTVDDPSAIVIVTVNGINYPATNNGNGTWTLADNTVPALADGSYTIAVSATDAAGNTGNATNTLTIDTTAPAAPIISSVTDNVSPITGSIAVGGTTNDSAPTLAGTAEPNATIKVFDGSTLLGTTTADGSGNWTFTPSPLFDGVHSLSVTATDAIGNVSAPTTFGFTVDTIAPATPVIASITDNVAPVTGAISAGGSTNDTTPTLTGTAEAGTTISIFDGGIQIGSTTANGLGAWSFTPSTPLSNGAHSLTVTATDTAGNVSTPTAAFSFTVDTVTPVVPVLTSVTDDVAPITGAILAGGTTNDSRPTLTGTAEAGTTISILDGSTLLGTTIVDGSGNWSFTPNPLFDGTHSLTATATDAAGNVSIPTAAFNFTVDTVAPLAPAITSLIDDVVPDTGIVSAGGSTNDTTPTLTGTAEAGTTINIFDGATLIGTTTANGLGTWTLTPSSPLSNGAHSLTATATDAAGNVSPSSASFSFTVDTIAPAVPVITTVTDDVAPITGAILAGGTTNDSTPTLAGTAEAGTTISIFDGGALIGSTTANGLGAWSFTPSTPLANGAHSLTATATDAAGNVSPPTAAFGFTVDTVAPIAPVITTVADDVAPITGAIVAGGTTNDTTPTLTGTAEAGTTISVYDGGVLIGTTTTNGLGTWSFTPSTPLSNGAHSLTATATDAAGNISVPTAAFGFTIDTTPPTLTVFGYEDQVGNIQGNVYSGGQSDDANGTLYGTTDPGTTIAIFDGATNLGNATVDSAGKWSFHFNNLSVGTHNITVIATDAAGNSTNNAFTLTEYAQVRPVEALSNGALLGIVGADLAGLIDLTQQPLAVVDQNGDLTSVTLDLHSILSVNAGQSWAYDTNLASALGLNVSVSSMPVLVTPLNPGDMTLTITSSTPGGIISNQAILELLGTVHTSSSLISLGVLDTLTLSGTDTVGTTSTNLGSLLNAGLLTSLLGSGAPSYLHETTTSGASVNRSADTTNDRIYGFGGNNSLTGGSGNDILRTTGGGNNTLNGGAGNDWMDGGAGTNSYTGGTGQDTVCYDLLSNNALGGHSGNDLWTDFHLGSVTSDSNADLLDITALIGSGANAGNIDNYVQINYDSTTQTASLSIDRNGTSNYQQLIQLHLDAPHSGTLTVQDLMKNQQLLF